MSDYDEMSLDELKELKAKREAKKLVDEFQAEDEANEKAKKEEYENTIRKQAIKDYLTKNPPVSKLSDNAGTKKDDNEEDYSAYLKKIVSATGQDKLFQYECACDGDDNSDCAGHDIDALRKDDVFIKGVWHALYCRANLLQFGVPGIDIKAGDGLQVKIRTVGKFSVDPVERSSCSCLDCGNAAFNDYNVCVKQFGMKTEICEFDIFDVGEVARTEIIKTMGFKWGEWLDNEIYQMLIGEDSDIVCGDDDYCKSDATHVNEANLEVDISDDSLATDECCQIPATAALYKEIVDMEAQMREQGRNPTTIILSPSVAALFKYERGTDLPRYLTSQIVVKNGVLTKIGDMNVIETCVANKLSDIGAGDVVAVMIDPARAFGFAYGKKPSMEKDRNIDCNSTTYAMWAYLGAHVLDCESIGLIKNAEEQ
jgi:hypothetical protein